MTLSYRPNACCATSPSHNMLFALVLETAHLKGGGFKPYLQTVNDYRLLIDKVDLASQLADLQSATSIETRAWAENDVTLLGQFLSNLLVGVGRYRRGEHFSARQLITVSSLYALLRLLPKYIPTNQANILDNLDPLRRFELAYPELGQDINQILSLDLEQAALGLLTLADRILCQRMMDYPHEAIEAIRRFMTA